MQYEAGRGSIQSPYCLLPTASLSANPDLRHLVQTFIFKNISCYFHTLIFFRSELEIVFLSEIPTL